MAYHKYLIFNILICSFFFISILCNHKLNILGVDAELSLVAFRLVLEDLLNCFQALNEGIVNILGKVYYSKHTYIYIREFKFVM